MKPAAPPRGHRGDRGGADGRPYCLRCRRLMTSQGARRLQCKRCQVTCAKRATPPPPRTDLDRRPCCVSCRRPMTTAGVRRFNCPACGVWLAARPKGPARRFEVERPDCRACGHTLAVVSREDSQRYACCRCRNRRRRLRERSSTAAALLHQIAAALPGYLTPDERDDAAQEVMLDILAGRLAPVVPTLPALRRYATAARGMSGDRFKFISLSQPTRNGREFGETLAA